ncbi:gamma-butyrobetaine dioxygenase [Cephus cinctus]|uniref:Gamma-butyrobetaine dioxygenase n=1 Tax=Cephus cinctus TaxID=211228 RepID=A0AAJ7FF69_CEPCN|nr:gamma-butyrobetaine dioxygenase [Cephus cinctus]
MYFFNGFIIPVVRYHKTNSALLKTILPSINQLCSVHVRNLKNIKVDVVSNKSESAAMFNSKDIITISTKNGPLKFPSVWLRDNCQCPNCFHQESQSRTIDWGHFDFNTIPLAVELKETDLSIEWSDNHKSTYSLSWLIERSFTKEKRTRYRKDCYRFNRVVWNAEDFKKCLKTFDYNDVMTDNNTLLLWLNALTTYGVSIITGTPDDIESSKKLGHRVAFIRETHYGERFIVKARRVTTNVAYLAAPLQLHTDLPYYDYTPGVILLHCLVQTPSIGGETQLTDCLYVAEYLKKNDPETYKVLTTTYVDWNDIGQEDGNHFHSINRAPVLCEDDFGDIVEVNFSQPQRDSHFNVPLEQAVEWYKAMSIFTRLLYSKENTVFFKMNEGEILTFDNRRLVHGRTGYDDDNDKKRRIIGCYLDWDEIYSKIRVLRKGV